MKHEALCGRCHGTGVYQALCPACDGTTVSDQPCELCRDSGRDSGREPVQCWHCHGDGVVHIHALDMDT